MFKLRLIRLRIIISHCRFTIFSFATLPEYIPLLCRGTLRILSKMLNIDILRGLFNVALLHVQKVYCKRKRTNLFRTNKKLKMFINFPNVIIRVLHFKEQWRFYTFSIGIRVVNFVNFDPRAYLCLLWKKN